MCLVRIQEFPDEKLFAVYYRKLLCQKYHWAKRSEKQTALGKAKERRERISSRPPPATTVSNTLPRPLSQYRIKFALRGESVKLFLVRYG